MFNPWLLAAAVFAAIGLLDETKAEPQKKAKPKAISAPDTAPTQTVIAKPAVQVAPEPVKKKKKVAVIETPTDG